VQAGLDAAIRPAAHGPPEDGVAVALIAHGWRGVSGDHEGAYRGLLAVLEDAKSLGERWVALRLAIEADLAYFGCLIGEPHELDRMRRVWTDRVRVLGSDHPDTLTSRALALAFTRTRAAKRDAALSLLSRSCPHAIKSEALRTLDGLFVDPANDALDDEQERAALPHLLSQPSGPGLLALVTCAATAPGIASALLAATDEDQGRLSGLTAAIITVVGKEWARSDLGTWLDTWLAALAHSASAEIPRSILDVVRREADGDATARPSLPPELRTILPRVRVVPDDA